MRWLVLVGIAACKGNATPTDPSQATNVPLETDVPLDTDAPVDTDVPSDTDAPVDTDVPVDTDAVLHPVSGAEGSITLLHRLPSRSNASEELIAVGLFGDDLQGIPNAAECFPARFNPCVGQALPAAEAWIDLGAAFEPNPGRSLEVGPTLLLGSYALQRERDAVFGPWYQMRTGPPYPAGQALGISFADGHFGTTLGAAVVIPPPAIELIEPDPLGPVAWLEDGGTLGLRWVPDPTGNSSIEVLIEGSSEPNATSLSRLFVVEDDGFWNLQVDALELTAANRELEITVARVWRDEQQINGNLVHLSARSEVRLSVLHPDLTGRLPLVSVDECSAVSALQAGSWFGSIDNHIDTFDPGPDGCTGHGAAGRDAIHRIELRGGERVSVRSDLFDDDGAIYLLENCGDLDSCVAGSDYGAGADAETLVYSNPTMDMLTLWLVVDSQGAPDADLYLLDVAFDLPMPVLDLADDCADAQLRTPIDSSTVFTLDLRQAVDHLSPLPGGCSRHSAPGPDVMLPVRVASGERIQVRSNAALVSYLLTSCVDETTCEAGAPPYSVLSFENLGVDPYIGYLVLDDPGEPGFQGPVEVSLLFESVNTVVPVDTCAQRADAIELATGSFFFRGTLAGFANDLDLAVPGPSCTGYESSGADGLIRVLLDPNEEILVEYTQDSPGDGVLYLTERCSDAADVLTCDDAISGGERIRHVNHTGDVEELVLVLDNWSSNPWAPPSGAFELSVQIREAP